MSPVRIWTQRIVVPTRVSWLRRVARRARSSEPRLLTKSGVDVRLNSVQISLGDYSKGLEPQLIDEMMTALTHLFSKHGGRSVVLRLLGSASLALDLLDVNPCKSRMYG